MTNFLLSVACIDKKQYRCHSDGSHVLCVLFLQLICRITYNYELYLEGGRMKPVVCRFCSSRQRIEIKVKVERPLALEWKRLAIEREQNTNKK